MGKPKRLGHKYGQYPLGKGTNVFVAVWETNMGCGGDRRDVAKY